MTPEVIIALVGLAVVLVVHIFKSGADKGALTKQIETLERGAVASTKEENDLDQRVRAVEQHLPALSTKVDSHAMIVAEMKGEMRAGFARIETLIESLRGTR